MVGRLEERRAKLRSAKREAARRIDDRGRHTFMMTAALMQQMAEDDLRARWSGSETVLALLFAHPGSRAMRALDERGEYLNHRTADTWDLFFPGYYQSTESAHFERECRAQPIGRGFARDWYFNPEEFNRFRSDVEDRSAGRWRYSGETDLVIVNAYIPEVGDITLDWASTAAGQLTEPVPGDRTMTVAQIIEAISQDLETQQGDEAYGVDRVVGSPGDERTGSLGREMFVSVASGIATSLAARGIGLQ